MNLQKLASADVSGKKVLVRVDLDVSEISADDLRLQSMVPTVKYLLENGASQIILIGHMGRPGGKVDENLSTKILVAVLSEVLGEEVIFENEGKIILKENLRFKKEEEENDQEFAKTLASFADIYVNDAFAVSHRAHASLVSIPNFIPSYLGLHFEKEIENLSKALNNPERPVIVLLSGIKEDKVQMIRSLTTKVDKILVGGRLPEFIDSDYGKGDMHEDLLRNPKVLVGRLIQDREDITIHTVEIFEEEIKKAGTIVLAGVLGRYEDEGHRQGTEKIFKIISETSAFKIAGGGDTETALSMLNLSAKFDWISVGGGAMVRFLIDGTLPGIEALIH